MPLPWIVALSTSTASTWRTAAAEAAVPGTPPSTVTVEVAALQGQASAPVRAQLVEQRDEVERL